MNEVKVVETELYSDSPTILKAGDYIGDFEITNISSSRITFKNPDPIKIDDGAMILGNNNVTMTLKQYQVPREFMPGMIFGEFEIESTASDTIILKNFKPIKFEPGKEVPILGGAVRIRTSAKEPVLYPRK